MGRIDLPDKTTENVVVSRGYLDGLHDTIEQLNRELTSVRGFDIIDRHTNDARKTDSSPIRRILSKR